MYEGSDRVQQVGALEQMAADMVCEMPVEITSEDITFPNLSDYLPEEWPPWFTPHDLRLLVGMIEENLQ